MANFGLLRANALAYFGLLRAKAPAYFGLLRANALAYLSRASVINSKWLLFKINNTLEAWKK
jgi:hypothetical protein